MNKKGRPRSPASLDERLARRNEQEKARTRLKREKGVCKIGKCPFPRHKWGMCERHYSGAYDNHINYLVNGTNGGPRGDT